MEQERNDLDGRIFKTIKFPDPPKLGKAYQWVLILVYTVLLLVTLYIQFKYSDIAVRFFDGIVLVFAFFALLIELYGIFGIYLQKKKEYELAGTDFGAYQRHIVEKIKKDLRLQKEYTDNLAETYGKQKKHYSVVTGFGRQPNGKIRP